MAGLFDDVTVEDIKAYRNANSCGLHDARKSLKREILLHHIDTADELDLRSILCWLVENA